MERNLNNDDFELFLKEKTDHYKLYPSDKVWKGVYRSLHSRKKWFKIGGSLLFLGGLFFMNSQFNYKAAAATEQQINKEIPASNISDVKSPFKQALLTHVVTKKVLTNRRWLDKNIEDIINVNTTAPTSVANFQQLETTYASIEKTDEAGLGPITSTINSNIAEKIQSGASKPLTDLKTSGKQITLTQKELLEESDLNWLQEMAAIKLTPSKKQRFNLQFYFSPTISYRRLSDGNKIQRFTNTPLAINQPRVSNVVDHKPAIGVELGSNVLFSPTKNLTIKSGLQVNYSWYTIKAFKYYFEKANIALLTIGRPPDTMSSYTSIRNFNGYSPEELQNQYVELSLPIGAEIKLLGNNRLQLNVAGTIQPTYLLFNDTYLLSTDYINYIKEPSLVRKWNVHTSAEAFVSYYIGGMRWQVGPQFRYQTLSSFNDRYPIKEYLIEYGVKFGVSKTLK